MINSFFTNLQEGFYHIIDFRALDHLLFLVVLTIPFLWKDWKKAVIISSFFTLAHTITLFLSTYNYVRINTEIIEKLIIVSIIITALLNIIKQRNKANFGYVLAFLFGLIHGFGFSSGFSMLFGRVSNKAALLIEFALGIELAQITIIIAVLLINQLLIKYLKIKQTRWIQFVSTVIILVCLLLF